MQRQHKRFIISIMNDPKSLPGCYWYVLQAGSSDMSIGNVMENENKRPWCVLE